MAIQDYYPRDLFDIHEFFKTETFDKDLKKGFIFYLASSGRPLAETLFPNLTNQRPAFYNHFSGMTQKKFTYEDFESTRLFLTKKIHSSLSPEDKHFLLRFEQGNPDWSLYDFNIFPAVQWKLLNIQLLQAQNPTKHKKICNDLEKRLA